MAESQLNRIETAINIGTKLDQQIISESVTSWMNKNSALFNFKGGGTFRVPTIYGSGLGDYRKDLGYPVGSATMEYKDYTVEYDRGRSYTLDAMDVDESNFVINASALMSELNRSQYIPEIDAVRFSRLSAAAIANSNSEASYTPVAATLYGKIISAMGNMYDNGFTNLRCHISNGALTILNSSTEFSKQIRTDEFNEGRLYSKVKFIDDMPLIATPKNRFYTAIVLYDGITSGEEDGGFVKSATGKEINFMIVADETPAAIVKNDVETILAPGTHRGGNNWFIGKRLYHDLLVMDSKKKGVYINTK